MAKFRAVHMTFWSDTKVENFTADEKYLFLYFLTNEHTNLCGCYEISVKKIACETGMTEEKAAKTLDSLQAQKVVAYSKETAELLVINWYYYNWTTSTQYRKPLGAEIERVKDANFREYLSSLFEYGDAELNITPAEVAEIKPKKAPKEKPNKQAYGENGNVLLTEAEYERLCDKYGQDETKDAIEFFDLYLTEPKNKRKYTDHNAAMRRWVFDAVAEKKARGGYKRPQAKTTDINDYLMQQATGGIGYEQTGCV